MSDGGDQNDGLWMLFFIMAFICAFLWAVWHFFTPQVLQGYLWLRQGEIAIVSLYTPDDKIIETVAGKMTFAEAREIIRTVSPSMLLSDQVDHWKIINATSTVTLGGLRIPFGILFVLMVIFAWRKGPTSYHRKKFGLNSLIEAQSKTFPVIKPIVDFNPLNDVPNRAPGMLVPAELPLFAEALAPEEWIAFNTIPVIDDSVDRDAVDMAFAKQLGAPWQGVKKLKPYQQILLAAFALKVARKRVESDNLLGEVASQWTHKDGLKPSSSTVAKARKILRNKEISASTVSECNRHAFVTTALLGALELARSEGGVLAPAQFLWLRGHDRALWYPLNNLGRQSYHAEALGAMSHYRSEKHLKRPVPKPMLKDAVDVLCAYIEDKTSSMPIPQLDFSMIKNKKAPNKNKGVMKPAGT